KTQYQEKFIFEAKVTGSLEHPGIVPVYGFGRYEDNQPYYAMRFIRGRSLNHLIREFHRRHPSSSRAKYFEREFRALLRRFIETCNAIHYAHEQGVLHRDIKPSNVMVGDYGETLVVDWGLAKRVDMKGSSYGQTKPLESVKEGSSSRTYTGAVVGTPMYMSPEQARGCVEELDGRTDVYSLGAMLFNIVTGGNPIEGSSTVDIITNLRQGKVRHVRDVVPIAPPPLASICRKAMAAEVTDRYESAVALADDVDRWVDDELVSAHRGHEAIVERVGRLIRRYRTWTISGAASMLGITTVAIVAAFLINHARQAEHTAKLQTQVFKEEAVERYRHSRNAIDTWLIQSSDALEYYPGTQAVRMELLRLAVEDYERLALGASRDPQLELERGRALVKVGDLTRLQQDYDTARKHYNAAIKIFDVETSNEALINQFRAEKAGVHVQLGIGFADQMQLSEAEQEFQFAITQLSALVGQTRDSLPRRYLAAAHINAGKMFIGMDDRRAIDHLTKGITQYESLGAESNDRAQLGLASAQDLLGQVFRDRGDHDKAMDCFEKCTQVVQQLVIDQPDHPEYLHALASVYVSMAASYRTRGLDQPMFEALENAVDNFRALTIALPGLPRYSENLAVALVDLSLAQHESALNLQAEKSSSEALKLLDGLVQTYGQSTRILEALASGLDARGQVFLDSKVDPGQDLRDAEDILLRLTDSASSDDEVIRLFERLAIIQSHLAQAYQRQNQIDLSRQKFEEAITRLESMIKIQGPIARFYSALAHVHFRYALMLEEQDDGQARAHFEMARDAWLAIQDRTADVAANLGWLLATCPETSVRDVDAALVHAREAVKLAPDNVRFLTMLALVHALTGQSDEALIHLERSKSIRGHWVDRDFYVLALAQHLADQAGQSQQSLLHGDQWRSENEPWNADVRRLHEMVLDRLGGPGK
ncbi:MAG: protein kinase, partial [Planctomycetales bacterium]|nr:protein kinase [Planctomycetales bacterium]